MSRSDQPARGVFITHDQESAPYQERILALAAELTTCGVRTVVDRFDTPAGEPRAAWTIEQMRLALVVLVVCTNRYFTNAAGEDADPSHGDAATWGFRYIADELAAAGGHDSKFVPVVFERADTAFIPKPLHGYTYYDVGTKGGFADLLRRIMSRQAAAESANALVVDPPIDTRPLGAIWAVREFIELGDSTRDDAQLAFWPTPPRERPAAREPLPFFMGDQVSITQTAQRHAIRGRTGFTIFWNGAMNKFLGQIATVTRLSTDGSAAVKLDIDDGKFWWASEWLEFIKPNDRRGVTEQ